MRTDRQAAAPALRQLQWVLARLVGTPRLYLQTGEGVTEPRGGHGRRYWVISRGLCRFFKVPLLPEGAAARQLDALALQVTRLSPFAETGSHHHFGPDFISLWLWDQAAVRLAAEAVGADLARLRVLPEAALLPPGGDGVRLMQCLDGIEGQSWVAGALAASRWWPEPPDHRAWLLFQRGSSVVPENVLADIPDALRFGWLDRPWTRARMAGSIDVGRLDVRLAAFALLAMLAIAYGYRGAEWLRLARDRAAVEARIAAATKASGPVLRTRSLALDNAAQIRVLAGLDRYPGQLALMARIARILPKNDTHLTNWNWQRGRLSLALAASQPLDALYFVRSLQKIVGFKKVTAERAGSANSLRIRLRVAPR